MTFMLDGSARRHDPFIEPAPRPFTAPGARRRAATNRADLDADRGSLFRAGTGQVEEARFAFLDNLVDRLGVPEDFTASRPEAMQFAAASPENRETLRRNQYRQAVRSDPATLLDRVRRAAEADPDAWGDTPLDLNQMEARIQADLRTRYAEYSEILTMAPHDALGVETLGEIYSDFATPENAIAMAASAFVPGGALARIGAEGVFGAGIEGAEFDNRTRMAAYLGTDAPDLTTRLALGFAFGAGAQGAMEGIATGARAVIDPTARADTAARVRARLPNRYRPRDPDAAIEAEGAVRQAEEAIKAGDPTRLPASVSTRGLPDFDALTEAVIRQESNGDANAVSPAGAIGLMQAMPATARDPGFRVDNIFDTARELGRDVPDETDETLDILLRDAEVNRAFGSAYLRAMLDRYDDLDAALVAYNAGPGTADEWVKNGRQRLSLPAETRTYIKRVNGFLDRPEQAAPRSQSSEELVRAPTGTRHPVEYRVMELDDLVISHLDRQTNPAFPPELQPRNRDTPQSEAQIEGIVRDLDPGLLMRSPTMNDGAPVIGPDNVVEVGNGRSEAIRRVYDRFPDRADAYRAQLASEGYDIEGFAQPILVRARLDDLDIPARQRLAIGSNVPTAAVSSPAEQATNFARLLPDETLDLYRPGKLSSPGNADFVAAAIRALPPTERQGLGSGEKLTRTGEARIEQMLLARAYDDRNLLDLAIEDPDELSRSVTGALADVAPRAAQLRAAVARGDLPEDFDVGGLIADTVLRVRQARANDTSIADMLDQRDLLDRSPDGLDSAIARMIFNDDAMTRIAPRARIAERFDALVGRLGDEAGGGLFGDDLRLGAGEIARGVLRDADIIPPALRRETTGPSEPFEITIPLAPIDETPKALRVAATAAFQKYARPRTANHPDLGEIAFTRAGQKKLISSDFDGLTSRLIPHLPEIVETARYLDSVPTDKPRKDGFRQFHYLSRSARIDGTEYDFRLTIAEDVNGNRFYNALEAGVAMRGATRRQNDGASASDADPQTIAENPIPNNHSDAPSPIRATGENAEQIARTMQVERAIRERIAADPEIANLTNPETGGTIADLLNDLEAEADLGAALHACTTGGRTT